MTLVAVDHVPEPLSRELDGAKSTRVAGRLVIMNIEQVKDRVAAYVQAMDEEVRQFNCSPTRPHHIVMASIHGAPRCS